ncbi:MAG TPA: hypothetical protein DCQ28_14720 [Bacteroidetes bacterium]|nr:hypothetical protein [Bacteroidota bacterium]
MQKTILLYGGAMAVLLGIRNFVEYRFYVRDLSIEFYIGVVALMFTILGVWVGRQLTGKKPSSSIRISHSTNRILKNSGSANGN